MNKSISPVNSRRGISKELWYFLMLAPLLVFVVLIAIYPLGFSMIISLFKYRLTDPNQTKTFIGLANYIRAFSDPVILKSIKTTLVFVAGTVSLELILGLGLALLLSAETTLMHIIRSFLLIPMALPSLGRGSGLEIFI